MKIWLKYLIGIALGIAAYYILPIQTAQANANLDFIVELVVRIGRYMLLPLLFFSITTACFRLREEKLMFKTGVWTFGIIIVSTLLLVVLGLISGLAVKLPRIPITIAKTNDIPSINVKNLIAQIFPYNGFDAVLQGAYLLPCFIFAGLAGAGAASDRSASKDAVSWFDSMSHVCYSVMTFFTEILAVGMIAIMCKWTLEFAVLKKAGVFTSMINLLTVDLALVGLVIYPLILRFLCHDRHPWRVLYASISPFLMAFFSGDTNLTLPLSIRHGNESLGIRRRVNAVTFPLFAIFARGGAALIQIVTFIVILRSYSSTNIDWSTILWIGGMSFLLSFAQCSYASGGPFIAIAIMCIAYGPSYEAGYLLVRDAAPILCAYAAGFDALTAMFGSYIVGCKTKTLKHVDIKHFI